MTKTILHITDMHLNDVNGTEETLSIDNYREYIGGLIGQIRENKFWPIDCVIGTGDFIHCGKVDNFAHARTVLSYIATKLSLANDKVAVCCGGHDIIIDEDKLDKVLDARKDFYEFSLPFANGSPVMRTERATLCKLTDGIYALMLDATLGSKGENQPGDLSDDEVKSIMRDCVIDRLESGDLLIVGAHYPMIMSPGHFLPTEEPDWHKRHYWNPGFLLRDRIARYRASEQTLWLYGDIHAPDHIMSDRGTYHVVTGSFGSDSAITSHLRRQAKVIQVYDSPATLPRILTLQYEPQGHKAVSYRWHPAVSQVRDFSASEPETSTTTHESTIVSKDNMPAEKQEQKVCKIEILDDHLERDLVAKIEEKELYRLGRFHTSEENISLSWVSIGPLLNSTGVLANVIKKMDAWLETILKQKEEFNKDDVVLLGMDCWGAVLASQLSVGTGIKNYCVAARGRGVYHTQGELINDEVSKKITEYKVIVFVCDVLATGHSIKYIYTDIQKKWAGLKLTTDVRWLCLSLIMDEENARRADCDFIEVYGTACKNLRMPVVQKDALPSVTILPPTISFS